jgi:hypothetical protein
MRRPLPWGRAALVMLGLTVGVAGPVKAGGNLVSNGDFATGDFTGWTLSGDTSYVYVSGTPGSYAAALTTTGLGDGFLSQSLSTMAGQEYVVSFSLAGDGATPNSLTVSLGGTSVTSLTDVAGPPTTYTIYTYDVMAPSSPSTLLFDFVDVPGYLYLANISVTLAGASVPEPSTAVSASLAALMLIGCYWRNHRKPNEPSR